MKNQQQSAAQRRANAEQMRREADELLDGVSEAERAEMERWARAMQREQASGDPRPFDSELVDARDPQRQMAPPEGQKPIAEWYDPDADYRHDPLIAEGGELDAPIREAMRSADRAMEDNVIPRRFRNVQRYFELARQAAEQRDTPRPQPAPLAPEVNPD